MRILSVYLTPLLDIRKKINKETALVAPRLDLLSVLLVLSS